MSTPRTSVKMAALAPMPSASVMITTNVNPGDLRSWRKANFRSFISFCSQSDDRIDTCSAAGWHTAGDQRDCQKRKHGNQHSPGVDCADVVKQRHQRAACSDCTDQSDCDADRHQ